MPDLTETPPSSPQTPSLAPPAGLQAQVATPSAARTTTPKPGPTTSKPGPTPPKPGPTTQFGATPPVGPTPSGPTPSGPTPSGPTPSGPTPSGPTPSGPTPPGPTPAGPALPGSAPVGPTPTGPALPSLTPRVNEVPVAPPRPATTVPPAPPRPNEPTRPAPPPPPRPPEPPRPVPPPPPPPPPSPSRAPLLLGIVGFLLLLGVAAWLWTELQDVRRQLAAQAANDPGQIEALEGQVHDLARTVQTLQDKPPPAPPPPVDLGPLEQRLTSLEQRPAPPPTDLKPLEDRLATLENRPPPPPPDDSAMRGRLQDVTGQVDGLAKKLDSAETQLASAKAQSAQSDQRALRAQRLETAMLALTGGRPLGDLAGAPPALTRFATAAPPTEASLRLSFEAAAKAAEASSDPAAGTTDLGNRIWQRVQTLVTVRQGDHVLVGAPASVVLADARQRLVAGDLAGAVTTLDRLDPAAAKAMADWRGQAQSLLDARAALGSLASAPSGTASP